MSEVTAVFAPEGALSKALPGFQPRPAQQQMAAAITQLQKAGEQLVVEAETGTGKTFAYLAPALLQSGKVILSTGTRNLQEQLFHRDLPQLRAALAPRKVAALLKGRSNYLCLNRMEQVIRYPGEVDSEILAQLQIIRDWANRTKTGDLGEIAELAEDSPALPRVTSTIDNCLGRECPQYEDCYLVKARKEALEADIVVVNHHLFCADLVLKDTGFGELIPAADLIVFDEAHQLPDIASQYFSETVSTRMIVDLCKDLQLLYRTEVRDARPLSQIADQLERSARDLRLTFAVDPERGNWRDALATEQTGVAVQRLADMLQRALDICRNLLGRSKELDQCYERLDLIHKRWQLLQNTQVTGYSYWYETTPRHLSVHRTPLSVAEPFGRQLEAQEARWVFTSATLTVNGSFTFFNQRLGLGLTPAKLHTLVLDSPFDFQKQALLCLPRYLPEPNSRDMSQALVQLVEEVVAANHGGTFVLFTSHRMLQLVAKALRNDTDRLVLVQGTSSKRELLNQFVAAENAILLGTSSFWEGVDVRGDALRCVIIDKLPFSSPDEPLLQARVEDCRLKGEDPFAAIQIPQAVIAMKQGAGRLVRDVNDRGVLIICDNRMVTKQYGQTFIASLPPMQRTRSLAKALEFLRNVE
ncbi:ATP-dependent DNA helicase [Aliidiomarina haloalkalitolerans]|uniref:ATP-dependent DNA helicase YoaA n=1 Tax=Aliidiomarina haloalkalitolerans TaxID=859059 RepID=A0A432VXA4_9GAMM|nr:ATP-dependent DNA helicase [Aliidiomarina haloalkalitolerans]RUO21344.1 ATP-dependent helicase [Aliidiomarina haloalkalitolerans]